MAYLLDTNVLVYMMNPSASQHPSAAGILNLLGRHLDSVFITPQILIEYYRTATRPISATGQRPGLGLTPNEACKHIEYFYYTFGFLPDTPAIFDEWQRIVQIHNVIGANAHDARIVATMWTYGIDRLLTFNTRDFQRYPRVRVILPDHLLEVLQSDMPGLFPSDTQQAGEQNE